MRNRFRTVTALLLAMVLSVSAAMPVQANSAINQSIKEKEQQIKAAEKEREELKKNLSDIKKMKEELEEVKQNLTDYVVKLDGNLAQLEQNIASLQNQITVKEAEITQTEEELAVAQAEADNQYESMKNSIRFIYEADTGSLAISYLLSSESFGDFLNKADYVGRVFDYGQEKWQEYVANCEYIDLCRQQLELEKAILNEQKQGVEAEQAKVEDLIREKEQQIVNYQSDINNKEQIIKDYEADIAAQNELISQIEAAIKEEKKKLQGGGLKYDGGVFKFPLASYTRISDDYGTRTDPFLGIQKFHSGVDFAAPKGTAIYAAYDGKVAAAAYSSSMGNYVMIDHGDELYTIYMHASALYVSRGDTVSKGDTIAAVGSTGRSTGNHLHFSVRKNGTYTSPWNYLSK